MGSKAFRTHPRWWLSALAVIATSLTVSSTASAEEASWFPLEQGTTWTYDLSVEEQAVTEGEEQTEASEVRSLTLAVAVVAEEKVGDKSCQILEYRVDGDVVQKEYYYVEGNTVLCPRRIHAQSSFEFQPHQKALESPLAPGSTWEWTGKVGIFDGTSTFKVADSTEKITVKAGEFDCLLVELDFKGGDGSKGVTKRWYAAGVGIVKEEGTIETYGEKIVSKGELVSFQAGKASDSEGGEEPTDKPADAPADKPADAPADKPADAPADKPADAPADKPADAPADKPADAPADKPADAPADKPAEKPADKPAGGGSGG